MKTKTLLTLFVATLLYPVNGLTVSGLGGNEPYVQNFVLTAYYSPLPGQCCYVKGGYVADKILNGEGHTAADGTSVYPGMLAAPPEYAFGTVIDLETLGVMEIHDRGGAIQVLEDGSHRLDVWVGHGEEGLARALAFGVKRLSGMVYPNGSRQPEVAVNLEQMPAPVSRLEQYLVREDNLMALDIERGDTGLSVVMLQDHLRELGYFAGQSSGYFGEETQVALASFLGSYAINQPSEKLTKETGAHLLAALRRSAAGNPVSEFVDAESSPSVVAEAQRLLRFFGYYKGRTDGVYDEDVFQAILSFQKDHALAGDNESPGAGRIGPLTMAALRDTWNKHHTARKAGRYLDMHQVETVLTEKGRLIDQFMWEGYGGDQVELLQTLLAERGYFPEEEINGYFGPLTKQSLAKFQVHAGIIPSLNHESAGRVGPSTLAVLRTEEKRNAYRLVRSEGWQAL